MKHRTTCGLVSVLLSGALVAVLASPPVIGTATARGQFLLDNAAVQGNATLLEGSVLETRSAPSRLRLQGGAEIMIGSGSRGRVYGDRLVLEKGEGRLAGSRQYRIDAGVLRVLPDAPAAAARVAYWRPGTITVAAMDGPVSVATADGVLLARLDAGMARAFEPQAAGAAAPVSATGCLSASGGLFLVKDETANLSFELRGQDLSRYAGQRVAITATHLRDAKPAGAAAHVLQVTQVKPLGGGCPSGTAGAGAAAATSSVSTKAIVAGVAVAAVAGGTALGLTGERDNGGTISR